ncbi:MAG: YhbY family RNA-binding protein [Arenicellales bacterium]|nr:YhbY family RNA-binding protein [Arenicellales bacterium]
MVLSGKQRQQLRGIAHNKKVVVAVGNAGVTAGVIAELKVALSSHEIVKVKLPAADKKTKQALARQLCGAANAENIQEIGRIAVLYRPGVPPVITLKNRSAY